MVMALKAFRVNTEIIDGSPSTWAVPLLDSSLTNLYRKPNPEYLIQPSPLLSWSALFRFNAKSGRTAGVIVTNGG